MTTPSLTEFIAEIHRSPSMAVLVVTGGGSQALADLFVVPGASRTVLEALVPYSDRSMGEFLGYGPSQAVSAETAAALARKAYERALALRPSDDVPVLGVASTAALVTDRPRKGEHRAHVAVCGGGPVEVCSVTLEKDAGAVRARSVWSPTWCCPPWAGRSVSMPRCAPRFCRRRNCGWT